jgi:hypothetical protein
LRQVHNKIRKDVSRLRAQNDKLSQENDNLERETAKVQGMEASLSGIMEKQGSSVGTFIDLVKENKSIQNKINVRPTNYDDHSTVIIFLDRVYFHFPPCNHFVSLTLLCILHS